MFSKASFVLIGSFRTADDFTGWEWIQQLSELSLKYKPGLFRAMVKIGNQVDPAMKIKQIKTRFTQEFLKTEVIQSGQSKKKVLVCGPPEMNTQVFQDLVKLGMQERSIVIV